MMRKKKCELCPIACTDISICMGFSLADSPIRTYRNYKITHIPIEKIGFYHYYPGSSAILVVTSGCNLLCSFCPEHDTVFSFSREKKSLNTLLSRILNLAERMGCHMIAFYCNSILDIDLMKSIREKFGYYKIVTLTNGFISSSHMIDYIKIVDAILLRIFGFSEETYSRITPFPDAYRYAREFIDVAKNNNKFLEVEFYVIPGITKEREFLYFLEFLREVNRDIPLHVRRFRPNFVELERRPTRTEVLLHYYNIARKYLNYVYADLWISPYSDTFCPNGHLLISRFGWKVKKVYIKKGRCPICGVEVPIVA